MEGYLCDISIGGCFLNTSGSAEVDQEVLLEMPVPPVGEKVVKIKCSVVPQERRFEGFGLRFHNLTEVQQTAVAYFVEKSVQPKERRDP